MAHTQIQPAYQVIVDWLSFTLERPYGFDEPDRIREIEKMIRADWPEFTNPKAPKEYSRRPYTHAIPFDQGMLYFSLNLKINHVLIELSGQGCQNLRDMDLFTHAAIKIYTDAINVTRLDIAVDIETDTRPENFVIGINKRWTDQTVRKSESGETVYLGSMKSDRYCRVYRYDEPHERSHLLRVEVVHRKKYARLLLGDWLMGPEHGEYAGLVGKPWGFVHRDWVFSSDRKVKSYRTDTKMSGTTLWMQKAVIPAITKLRAKIGDDHPVFEAIRSALPPAL